MADRPRLLVTGDGDGVGRPFDTRGHALVCDRCSSGIDVTIVESCRVCGPVPLCAGCRDEHAEEMCDDDEYGGVLVRGLN